MCGALRVNERKVRKWLSGKTRPANLDKVISYVPKRATGVNAWLGIEEGTLMWHCYYA